MSSSEKFCLRWNDFETNISVAFRELREEKDFFDVTLACDDSQIQAHKVILSACSPFFRNVLRRNPHQHPLLYLKGVKYKELLSVLNFMYMGEVNVAQEELNSFLAVAEDLRVKGLTQNNSSSDTAAVAASKPKQEPPKIIPRPRDPPERDPVPPPKRPRPTPPVNAPAPAQSYPAYDDDDIQEVVPVKSEPRDPAPTPMAVHHATPLDNSHSVSQYEVVQQQQAAPTPMDQNTVALDETYGDESYDYGQYGDGSYDDGSGMIDPNTGMPMQGAGPDGNKVLKDVIRSNMVKIDAELWGCAICDFRTKFYSTAVNHIEAKHVVSDGFQCDLCTTLCPTRQALKMHKSRKHR
eukprot:GFUD01015532.1.p1 GENE.GFUD01015532.1~~GFUD01015532.1.p1  ORF type:complete len:351 (-),score=73.14 GFUD01015532.1:393-1445(-)